MLISPGMARPPKPVVDHAVRPAPQAVAASTGQAPLPPGWQGPDSSPQVANVGLPAGLPGGVAGPHAPNTPAHPPPTVGPPPGAEAPRVADPGARFITAHRHTDTLPLGSRPGKVESKLDVQRFHPAGPSGGAPTTRSASEPRPSSQGPPPRHAGLSSTRGRRRNLVRTPQRSRDLPRKVPPLGIPRWHRRRPTRNQ